jgi:iron complex transport system substrate-binding protein
MKGIAVLIAHILVSGCQLVAYQARESSSLETFDSARDYFPDKAVFRHLRQLQVEYHRHYKIATFRSAANGEVVKYLFVQRGAPVPEIHERRVRTFFVPIERFALGSFRYGATVVRMGVENKLTAVPFMDIVTVPEIRRLLDAGKLHRNSTPELLLGTGVEALFSYYSSSGLSLEQAKNEELGINDVLMAEHLEGTPLAKTEWIKFLALFFNKEREISDAFDRIEADYLATAERVRLKLRDVKTRPRVLANYFSGSTWSAFGGRNAFARLIADAGGDYVWKDLPTAKSIYEIPYEVGYDAAGTSDVWIVGPDFSTQFADGRPRYDDRLKSLTVARNGRFYVSYNPDPHGRNPYWDRALINPHLELTDYVKAIHPDLFPEHEFVFLRQLSP